MAEYVKFSGSETMYGMKNLLHSELDLLGFVKRIRTYKKLRKDELVLRLALKNRFEEIIEELKVLYKLLPHDKFAMLEEKKKKSKEETAEEKEVLTLEQELEVIRRRLDRLDEKS